MCVVHTARPISHIPVLPRSVQRSGNKDIGDKSRLDNSETNLRCFAGRQVSKIDKAPKTLKCAAGSFSPADVLQIFGQSALGRGIQLNKVAQWACQMQTALHVGYEETLQCK